MNLFSIFLAAAEASTSSGAETGNIGSSDNLLHFIIVGVLTAIILFVASFFSNKKREKKYVEEIFSRIKVGAKVKTLGGFVGTIEKIDEEKALLTLNIGTEDSPTYVVIDKTYIYQIEKPETVDGQSEGNKDYIYVNDSGDTDTELNKENVSEDATHSGDTNTELKKENVSEDASETEEASTDEKSE